MAGYKNVMILGEVSEGRISPITKELLGCGKRLATDLGEELIAVFIGHEISTLAKQAIAFAADTVYSVDAPFLQDYEADPYLVSMQRVLEQEMPRILLLGQTFMGQDLAPRLAFKLKTALVLDCVDLSIAPETKLLLRTKPVYGGKALACFTSESYPQMATVRSKSMQAAERADSKKGKMIQVKANLDPSSFRTKILGRVTEKEEGVRLEDAEVVVAGGRGIGSAEGFKQLEELAKTLKGAVGATRAACDNEWVPTTVQIGLTGKIVAPKLYIAVGLSGSSQHMAGCSGSGTIVAINNDSRAHIFKEAKLGVIGDWKIILPAFTRKVLEIFES